MANKLKLHTLQPLVPDKDGFYNVVCNDCGNIGGSQNRGLAAVLGVGHRTAAKKAQKKQIKQKDK